MAQNIKKVASLMEGNVVLLQRRLVHYCLKVKLTGNN